VWTPRAVVAVTLVVVFPVLWATAVAGLVALDVLLWRAGHTLLATAVAAAAAALALLLALVHSRPRFTCVPGGICLDRDEDPRLHAVIDELATHTGVHHPDELWITPHPNAFTLQETAVGVAGRRTVLGIGMPLLVSLSVEELRAVVAHELGHFSSAESALASLVHRGRLSMLRTMRIAPLGATRLFTLYGRFFLRVTAELSRRQELAADRLAAQLTGPDVAAASLVAVERIAAAYAAYLQECVGPMWVAGRYPERTFLDFARFLRQVDPLGEIPRRERSPYDSHPSLTDRLARLEGLQSRGGGSDATPAWSLVDDVAELDRRISTAMAATAVEGAAQPVAWEDMLSARERYGTAAAG
jgi:Zn-dependent protease with chaperone function